ncbi:MAG TPA: FtsX-like permease family protein [Terriglobia bacterium]|nr:FtsX-like permease family protein [Terriglobia bacterium]
MNTWRLFFRLFLRPLAKEKVRTALTVLAVALGVGVVVAIDLAGDAATGSFRSSVETLTGAADFEVTAVGGVPDDVLVKLVTLPYPLRVHARIEDSALLADTGETVPLIGVDMVADALETRESAPAGRSALDFRDAVWVTPSLGLKPGEKVRLIMNDRESTYTVRGLLAAKPGDAGESRAVVMDMATAKQVLGRGARLDRILVQAPRTPGIEEWERILRDALPLGVALDRQGARREENRRMLEAFRLNLRVLSYIALIVGAFLIYNTISVSVVRRRPEIGILRALGASRATILGAFFAESACFGLAGGLVGLGLGRAMAAAAVQLIGRTVQSLYVSSRPGPIVLSPSSVMLALAVGVGAALASGMSPAREAARVPPTEAMAHGRREYEVSVRKRRDLVFAVLLGFAAALTSRLPAVEGKPVFGYLSALLLVAASALAIPAMVAAVMSLSSTTLGRALGAEGLLASRSLAASLRRTSVLVGALATAVAMMVSVGIMVGSFRKTVQIWVENQLQADLYLRPAGPAGPDLHPTMSPDIEHRLAALPGVEAVAWLRAYPISYQGLPATLAAVDSELTARYGRREFLSGGSSGEIFKRLGMGDDAVVSEPFASKHHIRAGDMITLPLGEESHAFRVLGVYYDYADERGYILMDRSTLLKYLPDPAPSGLAVYAAPGARLEDVRRAVERVTAGRKVIVVSNRDLRAQALRVFDRTFAITYALEAIAILVAVMGIVGALLALVIDRRRELGLLRFLGGAAGQIRRLILFEAGLLGLLANLAGLALGFLLSLILIYVINKQSFGWTIQFHWPVAVLVSALSLVYAATVAAGLYPARLAMRLRPIEVIHEE